MNDDIRRGRIIAFFVSLTIHLAVAVIATRPGGPARHAGPAARRDAVPAASPARPRAPLPVNANSATRPNPRPGPGGDSASDSLARVKAETGPIGIGAALLRFVAPATVALERFGLTLPQAHQPAVPVESVQSPGQAGNTSGSQTDRRVARLPAPAGQPTSILGGTRVVEAIGTLGNSFHARAEEWLTHLWETSAFVLVVALLTFAFRRNRAHVRYSLWFSASVKFFIPFALLTNLGSRLHLAPATQKLAEQVRSVTIERISQPFTSVWPSRLWPPTTTPEGPRWLELAILGVWACGFAAIVLIRLQMWRRIRAAVRASKPAEIHDPAFPGRIPVRVAPGLLEPGVVGFWRPILLLPADIEKHLTPPQFRAVLAHELCHIQRRDNLTAAIHMLVEAVFWFHPLVWWIGARLVDERERACDEHVLRAFADPRSYADGILTLCKRYVDARLACVSGVSGADLKKRIEAIMRNQVAEPLGAARKAILAAAGIATVAVPLLVGMLGAPLLRAQAPARAANDLAFEAASVKPNRSAPTGRGGLTPQPGGRLTGTSVTAAELIQFAYELPDFQVSGGPAWLHSDRFALVAKAAGDPPLEQKRLMLRKLLAERFRLAVHTEKRELPFYALMVARGDGRLGPQLRRTQENCARADQPSLDVGIGPGPGDGPARCGYFGFAPGTNMPSGKGGLAFRGMTMAALAKTLVPMVHRSVSDQTGLTGFFDAELDFMAELPPPPPPPGVPNPWGEFLTVFTVLPEQLGLKLDARRGPVEVLVIDSVDQPTPD